jgi:hypothetical protein
MQKHAVLCAITGFAVLAPMGCQQLPGGPREQGAVIGGVGGAVAGAAIARGNPLLGALVGGALGAGGGYLVGAHVDRVRSNDSEGAVEAARRAQTNPATAEEARQASTADINQDGFVTMDEIIAMDRAGFEDQEMIRRMQATNQIFELTPEQEEYLVQRGVNREVVTAMRDINRDQRDQLLTERQDVVGRPR